MKYKAFSKKLADRVAAIQKLINEASGYPDADFLDKDKFKAVKSDLIVRCMELERLINDEICGYMPD